MMRLRPMQLGCRAAQKLCTQLWSHQPSPTTRAPTLALVQHRISSRSPRSRLVTSAASGSPAPVEPEDNSRFDVQLLGPGWSNRARLTDDMLKSVLSLPGTKGMFDLRSRVSALGTWKTALQRGALPREGTVDWPQEPFASKFAAVLKTLEMPRFTRRYPAVLDTLLKQMLVLAAEFEKQLAEAENNKKPDNKPPPKAQPSQQPPQGDPQKGGDDSQEMDPSEMEEAMQQAMQAAGKPGDQAGEEMQVKIQAMEGDAAKDQPPKMDAEMQEKMSKVADDIIRNFQREMGDVMENMKTGEVAFDDLNTLLQGSKGFDLSRGTWRSSGWRELDKLRKVLENCPELRELVRKLGRSGGKGPLRRAPEMVDKSGGPAGVIRSPLQPEEVRGLTRSNDLSRMLPSEMAMMAHGWPRKRKVPVGTAVVSGGATATAPVPPAAPAARGGAGESVARQPAEFPASVDEEEFDIEEYYLPGAKAARLLHRVRRAERMLMSYERVGWLDDQPSRVTGRTEIRPAAEVGPIILCLDTSGSMAGARETVAKALALECMRGAHRQKRACYLYAFSGPGDVEELSLGVDGDSLDKLLKFLSCSFSGGTDVDVPLKRSLDRLQQAEWSQADILMVTDGEIGGVDRGVLSRIHTATEEMNLQVHGLLVSETVSDAMKELCTHVHVFKSWGSVGGRSGL